MKQMDRGTEIWTDAVSAKNGKMFEKVKVVKYVNGFLKEVK